MDLLDYDDEGATLRLEQRELLMLMALIQEGRDSFSCTSRIGAELDGLVSSANILVEQERRATALGIQQLGHKMGVVMPPEGQGGKKKIAH